MRAPSPLTISIALLVLAVLCVLVAVSAGCSIDSAANDASSKSTEPSPSASRPSAASIETPTQAARRIFPDVYQFLVTDTERPRVLKGTSVGEPWAVARDYFDTEATVASWTLPDDLHTVATGMFAAMTLTPLRDDHFIVPMVKDGHSVCEFDIERNAKGRWEWVSCLSDPLPGGVIYDAQAASAQLRNELGTNAEIRFCVFLPSGLVFAVGSNGEREAAVYLTFNREGSGITGFDKRLPRTGNLYTPDELAELLTP
jgi:hypothetical protein